MGYTIGKPKQARPYSDAGKIDKSLGYVVLLSRVRIAVRVPAELYVEGHDLPGEFEPHIRQAVAGALVDLESQGFIVDYVAVEQFEDSGA